MSQYSYSRAKFGLHEFISWKYPGYAADSAYAGEIAEYIISTFPEKPSEAVIASGLNITSRWLQQECKKSFGVTYSELFRNIRVNAGVSLMYVSRLTYSQIAAILKYSSEKDTIRDFRKILDCSPSEVKKYLSTFDIKNIKLPDIRNLMKI